MTALTVVTGCMTDCGIIFPVLMVVPVGTATLVLVASMVVEEALVATTPLPVTTWGVMITDPGRELAKVVATVLLDGIVTPGIGA